MITTTTKSSTTTGTTTTTTTKTTTTTDQVCQTEGCKEETARLLEQMDRTVDPCQDFYQFACGGFINKTVIPKDKKKVGDGSLQIRHTHSFRSLDCILLGTSQTLKDQLTKRLQKLLEAKVEREELPIYKGITSDKSRMICNFPNL